MLGFGKVENGAWLALVLSAVAALSCTVAAEAQTTASPFGSSATPFGGGQSGLSGLGGTGSFTGTSFSGGSFTGSSFSGGFGASGSTSGTSFTGSSGMNSSNRGGFSGNWAGNFSGGSNRGTSTTGIFGTTGTFGSGATGAGAGSVFSPYYFNPMAAGAPNVTNPSFASPIYGGNATGGVQGGFGLGSGFAGNPSTQANLSAANTGTGPTTGARRIQYYTASTGFDYRPAGPNQVQGEVERVLSRSTSLGPNRNIQVAVEGPSLVLRGTVASDQDRHLAEALIRLTPGVYEVRNELEVAGTISQSRPGP
jgi:hypothetical protein